MILVVDNYDSFTFNLVQYLGELGVAVHVRRNDAIDIADIRALQPQGILLSPGPGRPEDAGVTPRVVTELGGEFPIFGVCLGHQAIAAAFGASIVRAPRLMHGRTSKISHQGAGVFAGLEPMFVATRYHSLMVDPATVPDVLEVHATCGDPEEPDTIMGIRHRELAIEGVQFHPESFLTDGGHRMLANWLMDIGVKVAPIVAASEPAHAAGREVRA